ncbi:MAG TPA: hypothetical protein VG755_06650 [Nannocystaceae bacterium]|nr:hypothetical protein [Nannocystaceae bacterium]
MSPRTRALVLSLVGATWIASAVAGVVAVESWTVTAGATSSPAWPNDTRLIAPSDAPVLLMFAHPHCPCTRASLRELARLALRMPTHADVRVLFGVPADSPEWAEAALVREAAAIPGVSVLVDRDGGEAARFGVSTSGHVLIYGSDRALRFSGGITSARGHEGDNRGAALALDAFARGDLGDSAVFGCETVHGGAS